MPSNKNIGILTFHRTHNFGAFLQTFALNNITFNMGYNTHIINYQDRNQWLSESFPVIRKFKRPIRFLDYIYKTRAFNSALENLNLTTYTRNPKDLYNLSFSRVIVGSDIVWNYHLHSYKSPFFGYFKANRRIAYAPSFGWASLNDPPPPELVNGLSSFNSISVRDINSQKIVESIIGRTPPVVLDPTFLWDFSKNEVRPKSSLFNDPFLLVYAFEMTKEMASEIKYFAKKHNLRIIGVGYRLRNNPCDSILMGLTPFQWLWAVKHAKFIYTNTFHGTIFSIKYAKQFAVTMGYSVYPKLKPLLEKINLMNRVLNNHKDLNNTLILDSSFNLPHSLLKKEIATSVKWLSEALKEI